MSNNHGDTVTKEYIPCSLCLERQSRSCWYGGRRQTVSSPSWDAQPGIPDASGHQRPAWACLTVSTGISMALAGAGLTSVPEELKLPCYFLLMASSSFELKSSEELNWGIFDWLTDWLIIFYLVLMPVINMTVFLLNSLTEGQCQPWFLKVWAVLDV